MNVLKSALNITPSRPVPQGVNPFTPAGLPKSEMKEDITEELKPSALNFGDEDEIDMGLDIEEEIKEKGGRRRKSRKVRKTSKKSPKKSRKSKRKTTRKMRRHR